MKIVADEAGRIDKALARHFPGASRRALGELFDEGAVHIGKRRAKKGDRVELGDEIELSRAPTKSDELHPVADVSLPLDVLLERADFVVINKPAGMPSQPLRAGELGCAANAIAARWPECALLGDDPRDGGLVHRLDIGTSGVLIAARTVEAYRALRDAFGGSTVVKQYLALSDGRPVSRDCDGPLVQRGDHVRVDYTEGLAAYTEFSVEREAGAHSLVRCIARTGRMHQVRAHLAHAGAAIAGDVLYKGLPIGDDAGFFLHAERVELPWAGETIAIVAPLPARFTAALAACGLA